MRELIKLIQPQLQLCLAHYCDIHGPTPLMVTEGITVECRHCIQNNSTCSSPDHVKINPKSPVSTPTPDAISDALNALNFNSGRSASVPASQQEFSRPSRPVPHLGASATVVPQSDHAFDTPPESPRRSSEQYTRRDSNFRKTYDEYVTRRASPCENCALTLPKRKESKDGFKSDLRGPTLRTRTPYAKVYGPATPPNSHYSTSDTDGEGRDANSSRSSCSSSSTAHTHYIDYTSTHEPVTPESFSIVRASCLRTLSFETLPRAPTNSNISSAQTSSPQSPTIPSGSFVTTHSAGATVSGGPIFFGDPVAGYTTAYIFRIPDVHARGHKRVYAFVALSTHRENLTIKSFSFIASAFRDLANWIQRLAEAEAEASRANESSPSASGSGFGTFQPQEGALDRNSGSSFFSAGGGYSRRMGAGSGGFAPKARGLPELCGMPDFFIELHKRFVQLLFEISAKLNA